MSWLTEARGIIPNSYKSLSLKGCFVTLSTSREWRDLSLSCSASLQPQWDKRHFQQAHPCRHPHTWLTAHQPPIPQPAEPEHEAHLHMRAGLLPGPAFGSQQLLEKVFWRKRASKKHTSEKQSMARCTKCTARVGGSSEQRPTSICLPGGDFDLAFSNSLIKRSWDLIYCLCLVRSFLSLLCESLIWFVWIAKRNDLPDLLHHKDASWHKQACGLIWEHARL